MLAAVVGVTVGLVVAVLERLIVEVAFRRVVELDPWLIAPLPGLGLVTAYAIRRLAGTDGDVPVVSAATTDEYLRAFHDSHHDLAWRPFVVRTLAAGATLGSGVPMGLEGPSLYTGATIGARLQHRFPRVFRSRDPRVLMVAGAAAGVAAIFKAPATGAVFALEVPYKDDLARRMLLPALVASAAGYLVFAAVNGTTPLFPIDAAGDFTLRDLVGAGVLGVLAGFGARTFAWLLRRAKRVAAAPRPLVRAVAAGVVLAALFGIGRAVTGESLLVGSGAAVIDWLREPGHGLMVLVAVLVLRGIATSVAVAGGGVGGIFIPLVVGGAVSGAIVATAIDRTDLEIFVVVGVAAFLGAGYRTPLAAVMFIAETTGRPGYIVPGLVAAVTAELMMGSSSVTAYQVDTDDPELLDRAGAS